MALGLEGAYGECEGSQDKKIVMVSIEKGLRKRRCHMKGRDEEKSATQEENHNRFHLLYPNPEEVRDLTI